jgi:hypothetical protein
MLKLATIATLAVFTLTPALAQNSTLPGGATQKSAATAKSMPQKHHAVSYAKCKNTVKTTNTQKPQKCM